MALPPDLHQVVTPDQVAADCGEPESVVRTVLYAQKRLIDGLYAMGTVVWTPSMTIGREDRKLHSILADLSSADQRTIAATIEAWMADPDAEQLLGEAIKAVLPASEVTSDLVTWLDLVEEVTEMVGDLPDASDTDFERTRTVLVAFWRLVANADTPPAWNCAQPVFDQDLDRWLDDHVGRFRQAGYILGDAPEQLSVDVGALEWPARRYSVMGDTPHAREGDQLILLYRVGRADVAVLKQAVALLARARRTPDDSWLEGGQHRCVVLSAATTDRFATATLATENVDQLTLERIGYLAPAPISSPAPWT